MTEEENQLLIEHARAMPAAGYAYAKILYKDAPMEELISLGKIEQCSQTIPLNLRLQ
ncbi:hypothetical protein LC608_05770 [Nostoc sp. XA010]|uniref:hypothetical protein n=1 Tax=Nostoc sp. XA010 TaxID=2780407 RepID=UPI001E4D380D|nr:hypothetical protein [Nostoc sp. XA010]MCC5656494.1 hypothetical protein [Nostoc sp. XA010]